MFRVEGYKSGKCIIAMALTDNVLEAELLRHRLKKQFAGVTFVIMTLEVYLKFNL